MTYKKWIIATIMIIAIVIPLGIYTQPREIPPPPPFPQPQPGQKVTHPSGKPPTATPTPEEEKYLPKEAPPERKKATGIDTAPDIARSSKYEIVITRGETDEKVVIFVPLGTPAEEILDEYLNENEGDSYHIGTPPHAVPPRYTETNRSK